MDAAERLIERRLFNPNVEDAVRVEDALARALGGEEYDALSDGAKLPGFQYRPNLAQTLTHPQPQIVQDQDLRDRVQAVAVEESDDEEENNRGLPLASVLEDRLYLSTPIEVIGDEGEVTTTTLWKELVRQRLREVENGE